MTSKTFITKHAVQRFAERFKDQLVGVNITVQHEVRLKMWPMLNEGEDNRQLFNNQAFMLKIYEKHGFGRNYRFIVNGKAVFICHVVDDQLTVLTVISNDRTDGKASVTMKYATSKNKFKKK